MLECDVFLVIFQKTHQLLTKTFGAAVAQSRPCAFVFPPLFVASAPYFATCTQAKEMVQSLCCTCRHAKT